MQQLAWVHMLSIQQLAAPASCFKSSNFDAGEKGFLRRAVAKANERLTTTVSAANANWNAQPASDRTTSGVVHALFSELRKEDAKINIDLVAGIGAITLQGLPTSCFPPMVATEKLAQLQAKALKGNTLCKAPFPYAEVSEFLPASMPEVK